MADDATRFRDEFVPNIQGSQYHPRWVKANPNEASKWAAFRDKAIAYKEGDVLAPPSLATKYGKALVAAGKLHMSVIDLGAVTFPPPPPPDPRPYPSSYFTGPLGANNILPPSEGAFLITWGISEQSGAMEWEQQKANILTREAAMGRIYDGLMVLDTSEYWGEQRMQWVQAHGSIPIVAGMGYGWGPVSEIANGNRDAQIDAQANHWASLGFPLMCRLFQEFDLPGVPVTYHGYSAATWIAAWRRVVDRTRARGATNVGFWWCPTEGYDRAGTDEVYPGDAYVDWVGTDNYNAQPHGGGGWITPLHAGWAEFWELFDYGDAWTGGISRLDQYGLRKPFVVGETGLLYDAAYPQSKGDWYRNIPAALRNMEHCYGVAFFDQNVSPSEPGNNWLVDYPQSNPSSLAGFIQMAQDPWFNTRT